MKCNSNLGLPLESNLLQLKAVCSNEIKLHPVSVLMALVNSLQEAENLMRFWKLSNDEYKLGMFIINHRMTGLSAPLKYYQDLAVDGWSIALISQLLLYLKRNGDANFFYSWEVPQLPLSGKDLLQAGVKPGPEIGKLLKFAMQTWKESAYSLKKDEILNLLLY